MPQPHVRAPSVEIRECPSTIPGCVRYEVFDQYGFLSGTDILPEQVTPDLPLYMRLYYQQHPRTAPPTLAGLRLVR